MFAATFHLRRLQPAVSKSARVSDGLAVSDLGNRCCVDALCMFYKIRFNPDIALEASLLTVRVPVNITHLGISVHSRCLDVPKSITVQFSKSFVVS